MSCDALMKVRRQYINRIDIDGGKLHSNVPRNCLIWNLTRQMEVNESFQIAKKNMNIH